MLTESHQDTKQAPAIQIRLYDKSPVRQNKLAKLADQEEEGKFMSALRSKQPGQAQNRQKFQINSEQKPQARHSLQNEPYQLQRLLTETHQTQAQEQLWKRQLIEHDIRLQNAKLQVQELQYENKLAEMRELLVDMSEKNQKIEKEKNEIEQKKDQQIAQLRKQVVYLEQQLIQANLELAQAQNQIELEQQFVTNLKREQELAAQSETFGAKDKDEDRKSGNQFLKMFKFDKQKDESFSEFNDSCDYANYLLEVQESKAELLRELKETGTTSKQVNKQMINLSPKLEAKPQQQQQQPVKVEARKTNDGYQITENMKEEIYDMVATKNQDKVALKKWIDTQLPLIRNKADLAKSKPFKEALKKGVPLEVRGEVWEALIGNELRINMQLYQALLVRVRLAEDNIQHDQAFKQNIKVIEEDLHRTFNDLGYFKKGSKLYQPLKNILAAFSVFRPDLGYVQGMSYVAGSLLMHSGEEFAGFKCFANMMTKNLIYTFYSFDMPKVNIFFHIFMRLLRERNPRLGSIFDEFQIQPSVFLFEWVVALFSNILKLSTSSRIWDSYFFYGDAYLMKVCLAICACLEKQCQENFEMIIVLFKQVAKHVTDEELFKAVENIKLTDKQYDDCRNKVENEPNLARLI